MPRSFKNPDKNYIEGNFKSSKHPRSPSPKRMDYEKKSRTKPDNHTRCTFIHPSTGKRCKNLLGSYPRFCELHTLLVHNVFIGKSQIQAAGNGLYAGPFGFKKGQVIGKYSMSWNKVPLGTLKKRCTTDHCWSYTFCDDGDKNNTPCWDGLDIRSTLMRNINDAHGSKFKNNCYFDVIKNQVYVIASKDIKPHRELFVSYGKHYWN
jgi:hypothetical protein